MKAHQKESKFIIDKYNKEILNTHDNVLHENDLIIFSLN